MKLLGSILSFCVSMFIVAAFVVGALNWLIPRWGPEDYVTVYQRICAEKDVVESSKSYRDCKRAGGSTWVSASTYRIDYERQRVISLGLWAQRYDDCQVGDRMNWNCRSPDGSTRRWMGDGSYFDNIKMPAEQISWFQYVTNEN